MTLADARRVALGQAGRDVERGRGRARAAARAAGPDRGTGADAIALGLALPPGTRDGLGVAARAQQRAGRASVNSPWSTISVPLTSTWSMPSAPPYRRGAPVGRSNCIRTGCAPTVSGSMTTTSACQPVCEPAALRQAVQARGHVGEQVDRLLDRHAARARAPACRAARSSS